MVVYVFITLSSIKASARNKLKHPGLHKTHPGTEKWLLFFSKKYQKYFKFVNEKFQAFSKVDYSHIRNVYGEQRRLDQNNFYLTNALLATADVSASPASAIKSINNLMESKGDQNDDLLMRLVTKLRIKIENTLPFCSLTKITLHRGLGL